MKSFSWRRKSCHFSSSGFSRAAFSIAVKSRRIVLVRLLLVVMTTTHLTDCLPSTLQAPHVGPTTRSTCTVPSTDDKNVYHNSFQIICSSPLCLFVVSAMRDCCSLGCQQDGPITSNTTATTMPTKSYRGVTLVPNNVRTEKSVKSASVLVVYRSRRPCVRNQRRRCRAPYS